MEEDRLRSVEGRFFKGGRARRPWLSAAATKAQARILVIESQTRQGSWMHGSPARPGLSQKRHRPPKSSGSLVAQHWHAPAVGHQPRYPPALTDPIGQGKTVVEGVANVARRKPLTTHRLIRRIQWCAICAEIDAPKCIKTISATANPAGRASLR